jgi:hypothetical protein
MLSLKPFGLDLHRVAKIRIKKKKRMGSNLVCKSDLLGGMFFDKVTLFFCGSIAKSQD